MVEGLALVLVLQDVAFSTRAQVAALGVGTLLRADTRRSTFVKIFTECRVVRVDDFASWTGAEGSNRCLDAAVGAGSAVATVRVALC